MCRARVRLVTLCVLGVLCFALAPATAQERIVIDPVEVIVVVEPQDVEQARSEAPDGTAVVGGHLGAQPGCPGVQAYVKMIRPDDTVAWVLSASADKDCDGDGLVDGGGDPMFDDFTGVDPAYILSSSVYATVILPDRSSYVAGQLLVGWLEGDSLLVAVWAAFVLHLNSEGEYLDQLYVGPQPTGPAVDATSCSALCTALGNTTLVQWGARALALETDPLTGEATGIVLAGWRHPIEEEEGTYDKDVFVTALTPDLTAAKWFQLFPFPGADQPLDLAVAANGDAIATGHYGEHFDVFAGRFNNETGELTHAFLGGGPQDDWGEEVNILPNQNVEILGKITGTAYFPPDATLQGDGLSDFRALLNPELELIEIELIEDTENLGMPAGPPQAPAQGPASTFGSFSGSGAFKNGMSLPPGGVPEVPPEEPPGNVPSHVEILIGEASSTDPALVSSSDDVFLGVHGEERPDHEKVEILFTVPIDPNAPLLQSVDLELESAYCTELSVALGGGDAPANTYFGIGGTEVCPLDSPLISLEIPADVSQEDLGYTRTNHPEADLEVILGLKIFGQTDCPSPYICIEGEDESIDTLAVPSED